MKWLVRLGLAFTLVGLTTGAYAATLNGVVLPDQITVDGRALKLNGIGLRTKTIFHIKIYVAGLYLETRSRSAPEILAADTPRKLELRMTHNSPRRRVVDELTDGFERSTRSNPAGMKARMHQALSGVSDLSEGQTLSFSYVPGKGTTVQCGTQKPVTVPGKDFADVLFSMWLGPHPFDEDLKRQLLGAS